MSQCAIPVAKFIIVLYEKSVRDLSVAKFAFEFPTDVHIVWSGQSFSRAGIANLMESYCFEHAVMARFMALIWMVTYLLCCPIMLLLFTGLFLGGLTMWLFCWPFYLCYKETSFGKFMYKMGMFFVLRFPTTFICIIIFVLMSPIQLLSPELTAMVLKFLQWTN